MKGGGGEGEGEGKGVGRGAECERARCSTQGSGFIKAGFGGEERPKCHFSS
jgi:hypothetical protein